MSEGPGLNNMRDLLRGSPQIDEAELELLRVRSLKRLGSLTDPDEIGLVGARRRGNEPTQDAAGDSGSAPNDTDDFLVAFMEARRTDAHAPGEVVEMMGLDQMIERDGPIHDPARATAGAADDSTVAASVTRGDAARQVVLFPVDEPSDAPAVEDLVGSASESSRPDGLDADASATGSSAAPNPDALAYCPYCATSLQPPPKADRRCTRCRQRIIVRQVGGRTVYLAEAALPVFEAERRRIAADEEWTRQRDHWLDLARRTGASVDRVARASQEPPSEGKVVAARTLYLAAVDRSFKAATKRGRWQEAARIRYDEALVLFDFVGASTPEAAPLSLATAAEESA